MSARDGVRRVFRIARADRDVDEEIAFHLDSRVRDLVARGVPMIEARALARREFGDVIAAQRELTDLAKRRLARRRLRHRLSDLRQDARQTWRSLAAAPELAMSVIVLLALGVGANAAVFSVANELFLHPPARVANPSSIARLYLRTSRTVDRSVEIRTRFSYAAFAAFSEAVKSRATLSGYVRPDTAPARFGGEDATVLASYVTPNFLGTLGAPMVRGRAFDGGQNTLDAPPEAIISYAFWQSIFGGDANVIGKPLEVTKQRYTIIGVAGPNFSGIDLDRTDVWLPIATFPWFGPQRIPWYANWRAQPNVTVIARLTPRTSAATLAALATTALRHGEAANVGVNPDTTATVLTGPILESLGPSIKPSTQWAITTRLLGVAFILLIVACANVANLLLLRGERRRREIALRLALGIPRGRLFVHILLESVMLAAAGAAAAMVTGTIGGAVLRSAIMPNMHWATSALNARVAAVAVAVALATGIAAGLAPALRAPDVTVADVLKSGTGSDVARSRVRGTLMMVQGAFSFVLLVGAGLFVRSLHAVHATDVGYDVSRVAYGEVVFRDPVGRFLDAFSHRFDQAKWTGLPEVAAHLRNTPNIEDAALASSPPMAGYMLGRLFLQDGVAAPEIGNRDPAIITVTPNYATVTGVQVARGRWFRDDDRAGAANVAIVSETTARVFWPGRDPLGQCLMILNRDTGCASVVGVTRNAHIEDIVEPSVAEVFLPMAQAKGRVLSHPNTVVVRARSGRLSQALNDLRRALRVQFPDAEAPLVRSIADAHEPELRPWRLGAQLFTLFGALALIVATFGVYSATAYAVSQRTREIAVRVALGAPQSRVVAAIAARGVWPIVMGLVAGAALSLSLGRLVTSMLYATTAADPPTLLGVAFLLLVSGTVGMLVPIRRAVRVRPMMVLRTE